MKSATNLFKSLGKTPRVGSQTYHPSTLLCPIRQHQFGLCELCIVHGDGLQREGSQKSALEILSLNGLAGLKFTGGLEELEEVWSLFYQSHA